MSDVSPPIIIRPGRFPTKEEKREAREREKFKMWEEGGNISRIFYTQLWLGGTLGWLFTGIWLAIRGEVLVGILLAIFGSLAFFVSEFPTGGSKKQIEIKSRAGAVWVIIGVVVQTVIWTVVFSGIMGFIFDLL